MADLTQPLGQGNSPIRAMLQNIMQNYKPQPAPTPEERQGALSAYVQATERPTDDRTGLDVMMESGLNTANPFDPLQSMNATFKGLADWKKTQRESESQRQIDARKLEYEDIVKRQKTFDTEMLPLIKGHVSGEGSPEQLRSVYTNAMNAGAQIAKGRTFGSAEDQAAWIEQYANNAVENYRKQFQLQMPNAQYGNQSPAQQLTNSRDAYEILRKEIATASATGNRADVESLQRDMQSRFPNGAPVAAKVVAGPLIDKAKLGASAEALKGLEKQYETQYNESVMKPKLASDEATRIMTDFGQLAKAQEAMKSGKFKEWAAGEGGKWLATVLPEGAPLRASIANAQSAETLTQVMAQAILQAAKGTQTEGDVKRAIKQLTSIGNQQEANEFIEAYMRETNNQHKLRETSAKARIAKERSFANFDEDWKSSPIMAGADGVRPQGSVKRFPRQDNQPGKYTGLSEFISYYKDKRPDMPVKDVLTIWNNIKE